MKQNHLLSYSRRLLIIALQLMASTILYAYSTEGSVTLKVGETATISLGQTYINNLSKSGVRLVTTSNWWKSTNTSVAVVQSQNKTSCTIKGIKAGTVKIQYDCSFIWDGYSRSFAFEWNVTVNPATVSVTKIELIPTTVALDVEETKQLTATVYPTNATNRNVIWSTSKYAVASVSSSGLVTARGVGTATITCRAEDGSGKYATCAVTVREKEEQTLELTSLPVFTYGETDYYYLPQTTNEGLALNWSVKNVNIASLTLVVSPKKYYKLLPKKAGTTAVTATQEGNDVYKAFSRTYTLTVNKADLTVKAVNCSKKAGEDNPELAVVYEGLKFTDSEESLTALPTITTSATKESASGVYPITVSGAKATNYNISHVDGQIIVTANGSESLYPSDGSVCIGGKVIIPVKLGNGEENITGVQFDVEVPDGMTLSHCLLAGTESTEEAFEQTALADGSYHVETIQGTSLPLVESVVAYLVLGTNRALTHDIYPISLKNIVLTIASEQTNALDCTSVLNVLDKYAGDASGDGKVTIFDAVKIVECILGNDPSEFDNQAADVDGNGRITIFDAVSTVNILLGQEE